MPAVQAQIKWVCPRKKKKKEKTLHSSFLFEYSFHLVITLGLSLMHIKLSKLSEAT